MELATLRRLNGVNIGLLLLSAVAATVHPVATFLVAYAVLGPLHYLTEIPWLHQRRYFAASIWQAVPFVILCLTLLLVPLTDIGASYLIAAAFFWGISLVVMRSLLGQIVLTIVALGLLALWGMPPLLVVLFGIMLTTLIHVGLFTWMFMFSGVRKTPEWTGIVALILLPVLALLLLLPLPSLPADTGLQAIYSSFLAINAALLGTTDVHTLFQSAWGLAILRLIAFLYTYHYLNWFSKTGIIGWHRLPRASVVLILALWLLSVALYFVDYTLGLRVLLFLSLLHVFLEFPLNARTMGSILGASPSKRPSS